MSNASRLQAYPWHLHIHAEIVTIVACKILVTCRLFDAFYWKYMSPLLCLNSNNMITATLASFKRSFSCLPSQIMFAITQSAFNHFLSSKPMSWTWYPGGWAKIVHAWLISVNWLLMLAVGSHEGYLWSALSIAKLHCLSDCQNITFTISWW